MTSREKLLVHRMAKLWSGPSKLWERVDLGTQITSSIGFLHFLGGLIFQVFPRGGKVNYFRLVFYQCTVPTPSRKTVPVSQ